jgi:hypothetical protein
VIEPDHLTGKTTRLVDWAIEKAGGGGHVVFLCAFSEEVRQVTDLVVTTAQARRIWERTRYRRNSVEVVGGGTITVVFGESSASLRRPGVKVAVDDWSAHQWSTRMYLHTWADEWRTEG